MIDLNQLQHAVTDAESAADAVVVLREIQEAMKALLECADEVAQGRVGHAEAKRGWMLRMEEALGEKDYVCRYNLVDHIDDLEDASEEEAELNAESAPDPVYYAIYIEGHGLFNYSESREEAEKCLADCRREFTEMNGYPANLGMEIRELDHRPKY